MANDMLILVDENDRAYGTMEKLRVHQAGLLHRAFSVFIFNGRGELLLQQRADGKYHSSGLWSNTCCSHPRPGEPLKFSVKRRLKEEMGLDCATRFAFSFIYKSTFDNGLVEHEFDHVFFGVSDQVPTPAVDEVKDWKYISVEELKSDLQANPGDYTAWLRICFDNVITHVQVEAAKNDYR